MSSQSNAGNLPKVEFEDIASGEGRLNKDISRKFDRRKGIAFKPDNILFGKLRPYLKNWLFADFEGIALGDFWVFKATDTSPIFDYYLIQADKYQEVANLSTGTKMPRSDWKVVSGTDFLIPHEIQEQTAIGTFFRALDDTITLHKRKLDGLKELKSGYLQVMFPQNGETVPRVRFNGFEGAWECKQIGELFTERSERSVDGELISVTINSGVVKASTLERKDNSSADKSNYKKVEIGDIAYNSMRMWQGASGVSNYSGILSPAYTVIIPNKNANSLFFSYMFKLTKMIHTFQSSSQGLTSDTWNLKFSLLKKIIVMTPSVEEQIVVGNFFFTVDEQIAAQSAKLEQLKQLKAAYLQKMFI